MEERSGVLPSQAIEELIDQAHITARTAIRQRQVQPATLDMRLGERAWRLQASFLPGKRKPIHERIDNLAMREMDIGTPTVLEKGCVYLVELQERLRLPDGVAARTNPKSSTGRLDVFTRTITDRGEAFDRIDDGYEGGLWTEVMPRTFPVTVQAGLSLSQMRFVRGDPRIGDEELRAIDAENHLVSRDEEYNGAAVDGGIRLSVDLETRGPGRGVAYRGRANAPIVDLRQRAGTLEPEEYWERIEECPKGRLILNPGDFYILGSRERLRVPPDYAAEMVPFDPSVGEFRIHYAGFFDPGFGMAGEQGTPGVLEVRAHETPFAMEHGQTVGRLEYSRTLAPPRRLYGQRIGSSYHAQGLTLSKQFRQR